METEGRIMRSRHFLVWYVLLVLICLSTAPVLAGDGATKAKSASASNHSAPALVRVPVYFITDRNQESNVKDKQAAHGSVHFGPHRKYIGDCLHDPFMGSGYCVVENKSGKALTPALRALGWDDAARGDKAGSYKVDLITGHDFSAIQDTFYGRLREGALKSEHKDLVVFAHGYKNSFAAAFHTAARFSYAYENPVVLYSWPSVAKMVSYNSDENNNEWSQEHFNDVLVRLEGLCTQSPPVQLRLFAHSMGSRLLVRGMPFLREKSFLTESALVCPDVDEGLVKHYARRYFSEKGTVHVRLYMSQHDKALAFSQLVHGGYCRLGECADSLASLARGVLPFGGTDDTAEQVASAEWQARLVKAKHRMQTVDFTNLDTGLIGHHIPVEVIYSMSYTNTPGTGLKLISEKSGERSKTSLFFSRLTHLRPELNTAPDTCFRVVEDDAPGASVSAASYKPTAPAQ